MKNNKELFFRYTTIELNKELPIFMYSIVTFTVFLLFAFNVFNLESYLNIIPLVLSGTAFMITFLNWYFAHKDLKQRRVSYFVDSNGKEIIKYGKWEDYYK